MFEYNVMFHDLYSVVSLLSGAVQDQPLRNGLQGG